MGAAPSVQADGARALATLLTSEKKVLEFIAQEVRPHAEITWDRAERSRRAPLTHVCDWW